MKRLMVVLAVTACCALGFAGEAGAQSKQNSPMNRCVRNCDSRYKGCMARKKSNTARCSDERRKCRNSCARGGR